MIELIPSIANLISLLLAIIASIIAYKLAKPYNFYSSIIFKMQEISLIISVLTLIISFIQNNLKK